MLNQLAERLAEVYGREGIGKLKVTRVGEQIDDLRLFAPDDCLIVFRFRVGEKGSALRLSIATSLEMIELVKKLAGASRPAPGSQAVARIVREIPVRTRVILGSWRVPMREVAAAETRRFDRAARRRRRLARSRGCQAWPREDWNRSAAAHRRGPARQVLASQVNMATIEHAANVEVELSAVATTLKIPAGVLAGFGAGDRFEIELDESGPSILLVADGRPFAIASVAKLDGRLVATITEIVSNVDREGYEPWLIRKSETAKP